MIKKDEADTNSVIDLMKINWLSSDDSDLVSLSISTVVRPSVFGDILRALDNQCIRSQVSAQRHLE